MRKLEEVLEYLKTVGMCAYDIPKLLIEKGLVIYGDCVKITNKTWEDFVKWYDNVEEKEKEECPCKDCEGCDIPLDEMESHLAGLWIAIHDIATEAIENPIDMCLQTKCSVKLNALAKSVLDVFSRYDLCLEVPEDEE